MNEQLFEYLDKISNEAPEVTHSRGFSYFHHGFMPALLEAGKTKEFDRELLAAGWHRAGWIYAMNRAPNRSLKCINKALVLSPCRIQTLQLSIQLLAAIGNYHKAFEQVNLLPEQEPDQMEFITLRQKIQDDLNYDSEPVYQSGNHEWELNELLAAEQFNSVINLVLESDMDNVMQLKKLACAYVARGHNSNYHQVWSRIHNLDLNVNFDPVDRFYRPLNL